MEVKDVDFYVYFYYYDFIVYVGFIDVKGGGFVVGDRLRLRICVE